MSLYDMLIQRPDTLQRVGETPLQSNAGSDARDLFQVQNQNQDIESLAGATSLIKPVVPKVPLTGMDKFFGAGTSTMDKINQGIGLGGSLISLANVFGAGRDDRKINELNMSNIQQQMAQSGESFQRNKARQDRTSANITAANNKAMSGPQVGGMST